MVVMEKEKDERWRGFCLQPGTLRCPSVRHFPKRTSQVNRRKWVSFEPVTIRVSLQPPPQGIIPRTNEKSGTRWIWILNGCLEQHGNVHNGVFPHTAIRYDARDQLLCGSYSCG